MHWVARSAIPDSRSIRSLPWPPDSSASSSSMDRAPIQPTRSARDRISGSEGPEQHVLFAPERELHDAVAVEMSLGQDEPVVGRLNIVHSHAATLDRAACLTVRRCEARKNKRLKQADPLSEIGRNRGQSFSR